MTKYQNNSPENNYGEENDATTNETEPEEEEEEEEEDDDEGKILTDEDKYLYKIDPEGSGPVIEYEHPVRVKTPIDRTLPDVKRYLQDEPEAADDELRMEVTDPSYFDLELPEGSVCLVIFYAPWCPHCRKFKPKYVELANELLHRSTGQVPLEFFALSCVVYPRLCDYYDIESYPVIMGFPLLPPEKIDKVKKKFHDLPVHLNKDGMADLTPDTISENLDFSVTKMGPETNERSKVVFDTDEERIEWEAKFDKMAWQEAELIRTRMEYPKRLSDIYMDASLSLVFALEHGIRYVGSKPLSDEPYEVLSRFVDMLLWTTPQSWGFYSVIEDIRAELPMIRRSRSNLKQILHRHDSSSWGIVGDDRDSFARTSQTSWSEGCTNDNPGAGFTCGLWQLFHIITVGAARQHELSFTSQHHDLESMGTLTVSDTIAYFVKNFFACAVCRDNFLAAYESCAFDVCHRLSYDMIAPSLEEARDLPLWLWEMHNAVNVRLVQEDILENEWRNASQVELDLAVFPNIRMCPTCRHHYEQDLPPKVLEVFQLANKQPSSFFSSLFSSLMLPWGRNLSSIAVIPLSLGPYNRTEKVSTIDWNKDEVFKFLRNRYWPEGEDLYPMLSTLNPTKPKQTLNERYGDKFFDFLSSMAIPICILLALTLRRLIHVNYIHKSGSHKKWDDYMSKV